VSNDQIVINSSPLITLCKSAQVDLLPQLFQSIIVPSAVWQEVTTSTHNDLASALLPSLPWVKHENFIAVPTLIQAWDLGAGESEVLAYALKNPSFLAVIDDAAARRCARSLGINSIGTVGLFILAKRRNLIAEVMPCIQKLRDAGLWMSDDLIKIVRQQSGE
jgi:predicted nucleic acid-binding protein